MSIIKPTRRELLKYGVKAGIVAFGVPVLLKLGEHKAQAAITDNLISYWDLSEASGTRYDSTASGNDLSDSGSTGGGAGPGAHNATAFVTSGSYLYHASNAGLQVGGGISFSIVTWIYLADTSQVNAVTKYTDVDHREYYVVADVSAAYGGVYNSSGSSSLITATTKGALNTTTWYMIAFRVTPETMTISVDAGTVDSGTLTVTPWNGASQFEIGGLAGGVGSGRVALTGLWKRYISDAEVTTLYNSGAGQSYAEMTGGGPPAPVRHRVIQS